MKLSLDDEEGRPAELTPHFFINLMITETKRKAVVQIIQFHKKKELTYSTKLSDGYFIVKVMFINKAAEQIENGQIRAHYVLQGWLRNHGEGVIMVREPLRFWKFASKIGSAVDWRLKKENVNSKGFGFIVWNSQQLEELHQNEASEPTRKSQRKAQTKAEKSKSQANREKSKSKRRQRQELFCKEELNEDKFYKMPAQSTKQDTSETEKLQQPVQQPCKTASLGQTQTQSLDMQKKSKADTKGTAAQTSQSNIIPLGLSTKQPSRKGQKQTIKQSEDEKESKYTKMTKSIMQFILDEQEEQPPEAISQKREEPTLLNQSKKPIYARQKEEPVAQFQKEEPIINLRFIYDILDSDKQSPQQPKKLQQKQQLAQLVDEGQSSSDEEFTNWLKSKKIGVTNQPNPAPEQSIMSSLDKKRQIYKDLLSSSQSQNQPEKSSKSNPLPFHHLAPAQPVSLDQIAPNAKNQQACKQKMTRDLSQIRFSDIYNGLSTRSNANWWTTALLCCLGPASPKDYANAILTDQSGHYLIPAVFSNLVASTTQFVQNTLYKLGKGSIRVSNQHTHRNASHSELQFDCSKATIEPIQHIQSINYRSENYQRLQAVYEMEDDVRLNTFGITKSIRNTLSKNGVISHYEIVDPIAKYAINFTQFDSQLTTTDIQDLINLPICIYNGYSSSYRGRKNVVSRPKTIIKYNWLPLVKQTAAIWQWLDEGNRIQDIDLNLVGYTECLSLDRIAAVNDGRVFVRNVVVLDINDKYKYLACVKCYKKVEEGRCRTCGKRNPKQVAERLLVRGNIGDQTSVLGVLWSNDLAQLLLRDGLRAFRESWELKRVSAWLERGSNDGYTIVKMKELETKERIKLLLNQISNSIL